MIRNFFKANTKSFLSSTIYALDPGNVLNIFMLA